MRIKITEINLNLNLILTIKNINKFMIIKVLTKLDLSPIKNDKITLRI